MVAVCMIQERYSRDRVIVSSRKYELSRGGVFLKTARITASYARVASRVVERTSRRSAEKQRRKEAENANAHCFFCFLSARSCSSQHFMQILPPGTSGELRQLLALDDLHLPHVVPASVKICVRCEERETRTARGEPRNEPWRRTSRVRVRVRGVGRTGMCAPRV